MAPAHILRLPLPGNPAGHVLVRVVPHSSSSSASQPLDLELTATEGEQAYVRILQHTKASRYRDRNSSLSDAEWEQCLTSLLLPETLPPAGDLDINAQLKDEETLTINIQKKVAGQTETVGTLTLTASESATEDISIFDWCNDVVEVRTKLEKELAGLKRKHAELEKLVAEEAAHFGELERSKNEFETEHDSFLRDLLNEKKIKIRNQGQVLSTAQVDEDKLADVSAKAKGSTSKPRGAVGASSKGKRKADGAATPDEETGDDAAPADVMDIDSKPESPEHDLEEQVLSDADRTTEGSETASEPDSEPEPEPEPEPKKASRSSARKKGARASPPPPARISKKSDEHPSSNLRGKSPAVADKEKEKDDYVPPPRALPFKKKPAPAPVPADDESTASEASQS